MGTLDKPKLNADTGKSGPRPGTKLLGSRWKFSQHGQSGHWMSELFPELAACADDLCFLHGMQTTCPRIRRPTCEAAHRHLAVRAALAGRVDALRSRLAERKSAGLHHDHAARGLGGAQNYGSAFLPAHSSGDAASARRIVPSPAPSAPISSRVIPSRCPAEGTGPRAARSTPASSRASPTIRNVEGAIESFELAYRMQSAMPDVMDISKETEATLKLYGIGERRTDDFGRKCLLARRMIEAGVRFVEVTHGDWDHHFNLGDALPASCGAVDQPAARPAHRPEVARPAPGHAGHLGRRVRPHAPRRRPRRPRPQCRRLHDVDGGRRSEGRSPPHRPGLPAHRRSRSRGERDHRVMKTLWILVFSLQACSAALDAASPVHGDAAPPVGATAIDQLVSRQAEDAGDPARRPAPTACLFAACTST